MIISVTASQCLGKTTLVKDFLTNWPKFKTPEKTYRDFLKEEGFTHSKETNKDNQWRILNAIVEQTSQYRRDKDLIVHDRCAIDNLVYSLWCYAKGVGDIDEAFIDRCIPLVAESLRNIDIIFFLPITKVAPVEIVNDGKREVDPVYRAEIDNIFKSMGREWKKGNSRFYVPDDKPAWIEIMGKPHERIQLIKMYLDADGDVLDSNIGSELILPDGYKLNELEKSEKMEHYS